MAKATVKTLEERIRVLEARLDKLLSHMQGQMKTTKATKPSGIRCACGGRHATVKEVKACQTK